MYFLKQLALAPADPEIQTRGNYQEAENQTNRLGIHTTEASFHSTYLKC